MAELKQLEKYVQKLNNNLKTIGVETGNITKISINNRALKRMGRCRKTPSGYEIEVSKYILNDKDILENTVYHELLHTVESCMNHGKKWQMLASQVNRHYNMDISRTGVASQEMKQEQINRMKYKATCQGCGQEILRQKASKFITEINNYSCGRCKAKFKVEIL